MQKRVSKAIVVFLCLLLAIQQTGFAQAAAVELNIAGRLAALHSALAPDKFRPLHLRYLQYNPQANTFNLLLDKGSLKPNELNGQNEINEQTKELLKYFLIGVTLPNDSFWVNLRPDSPDNIIDEKLAQTDIGKILLEADLQLKKDTAQATSPQTPAGREYWNKLYQKAQELFGYENVTIPTLTRPWIVPDEIIIGESADSAYVYKATLKVMLEEDYLKTTDHRLQTTDYSFSREAGSRQLTDSLAGNDLRLKELNKYSSQLIRELIIPKLTKEVNNAKRYAALRQVYYSLILAQWFKARNAGKNTQYARLIDRKALANLQSKTPYSVDTYFNAYKENFAKGEYNIKEPVYTPYGQVVRSYFSGGFQIGNVAGQPGTTTPIMGGGTVTCMPTQDPGDKGWPMLRGIGKILVVAFAVITTAGCHVTIDRSRPEADITNSQQIITSNQDIGSAPPTSKSVEIQPRNSHNLEKVYNFASLTHKLNKKELAEFRKNCLFPQRIKKDNPRLFNKIIEHFRVVLEPWIRKNQVWPTPKQQEGVDKANTILREFFVSYNLPYRSLRVVFVPNDLMPEGKQATVYPYYPEVIFISAAYADNLSYILIHEGLHCNAVGFDPKPIDEGMTWLLGGKLASQNHLGDQKDDDTYLSERDAILPIISKIREKVNRREDSAGKVITLNAAFELLTKAYLTGDTSEIERVLGSDRWHAILEFASTYQFKKADEIFSKGIHSCLSSPLFAPELAGFSDVFVAVLPGGAIVVNRGAIMDVLKEANIAAESNLLDELSQIIILHELAEARAIKAGKSKTRAHSDAMAAEAEALQDKNDAVRKAMHVIWQKMHRGSDVNLEKGENAWGKGKEGYGGEGKEDDAGTIGRPAEAGAGEIETTPGAAEFVRTPIPKLVDATIRETAEIYYEKGGWKLHLRVAPENYQAVHAWLWQETTVGYKHLHGGEPDEKDFTIYVCSKREADELARRISQQIGHLLKNPSSTMEEHDIELAPKVGGRFDMRHLINSEGSPFYEVARQFTPYGYKGIPFLDTDHGRFEVNIVKALHTRGTKLGSPEAIAFRRQALLFQEPGRSERAFRVLAEAYGEYFTGGAKSIEELRRGKNVDYPVKPAAEASVFTEQPKGNDSKKNPGGIDFRHLPIVTQSLGNLKASIRAMPQAGLERINLAQEWSDIERLVNSGITPSAERLKDYLAASCFSGNLNSDMEKIVACISDILRTEESTCQPTDPALKDILVVLGSGRSGEEIEEVFTGAFPL